MTDCNVSTPDDDEPFQITGTGNDAEWLQPIPPRCDLLDYAQAKSTWKLTKDDDAYANLAGWINSGRVLAYSQTADGYLSRLNWLEFREPDRWQDVIEWLLFQPVPGFDPQQETRYLTYDAVISILKKHNPKRDAAGFLVKGAIGRAEINRAEICTKGWPMPDLLAITLNSSELTPDNLPDCIYIRSQIQSLVDRDKVKSERKSRADKPKPDKATVRAVYAKCRSKREAARILGVSLGYVEDRTKGLPTHKRGPAPSLV